MANKRTYLVQGLNLYGSVAIGGLSRMDLQTRYTAVESSPDGAIGSEDIDRVDEDTITSITITDVSKINAILNAAPAASTAWLKESGAATWHKHTIAAFEITGFTLNIPRNLDAALTINGRFRYASAAANLTSLLTVVAGDNGSTKPALTYPTRLYRPRAGSPLFETDGAVQIPLIHLNSLTLSAQNRVIAAAGDDDVGFTAVDRVGLGPVQVQLQHGDAGKEAPAGLSNLSVEMLEAQRGVLEVILSGRGGGANKTLTVNNLLWDSHGQTDQEDYSRFTIGGRAGWRSPLAGGTVYTINGSPKLFSIA